MLVTPQETFLNLEEAAEALGMCAETLRERAAAGTIPGAKPGKEWRFRASRLAAYMASIEGRRKKTEGTDWNSTSGASAGTRTSRSLVKDIESLLGKQIGGKRRPSQKKLSVVR